jgi:hypothetical protein
LGVLTPTLCQQKQLPNDIDLKSAYCIGFYKSIISKYSSSYLGESDTGIKSRQNWAEEMNLKKRRLESYLLPRWQFLDDFSIIIAMQSYGLDSATMDKCLNRCSDDFAAAWKSCYSQPIKENDNGAFKRIEKCGESSRFVNDSICFPGCFSSYQSKQKACLDLSFLPY